MEALVIITIGIVLFYTGIKSQLKTKNLLSKGVKVEGIVFDIVESDNIDSRAHYPIIRFFTSEKEWITEEYDVSASPYLFKKGQKGVCKMNCVKE